jgi:hypothetical protein
VSLEQDGISGAEEQGTDSLWMKDSNLERTSSRRIHDSLRVAIVS